MTQKRPSSLGEAIRDARVAARRGLRDFAKEAGIAPSYLSDIENDRRVPAEEVLRKIAQLLSLEFEELMALAGRFGESVERYVRRQPAAGSLFRKISEKNLSEEELRRLQQQVDRMAPDKEQEDEP